MNDIYAKQIADALREISDSLRSVNTNLLNIAGAVNNHH